jgi:hypothetical protein
MRRLVPLLGLALATACLPYDDRNTCEQASLLLHRCGVSMPLLEGPCVGARIGAAECVLEHAQDCTGVATLAEHVDECLVDYGESLDGEVDGTIGAVPPSTIEGLEPTWEDTNAACSDGVDNDLDGFADCADAECTETPGVTVCGSADDTGL